MRATAPALALLVPLVHLVHVPAAAQGPPVRYRLSFPDAVHHEAEVEATFPGIGEGPLEVVMSSASPGRYAVHGFAKNVYGVEARDGGGRALGARRVGPSRWEVAGHDGTVVFSYTLFGDHADGTFNGIDGGHAHLNIPASLVWARGLEARPAVVRFEVPEGSGWRAATQLVPTEDPLVFTAPDRDYLLDSPVELADFELREWRAGGGGDAATIRLAVHHREGPEEVDRYAGMVGRVVEETAAVFGELPAFDHGAYTFIADYLPRVSGDGMEHRNSTVLTSTRPLSTGAVRNLGTVAHEFVHAWSMERLRSAALVPFDFEEANLSSELWFGEGFTSYYDDLILHRAGFTDRERFLAGVASTLNTVILSPGRRFRGPAGMSRQAPFVDEARWVDPTNGANTFISYYTYGSALGLGLDLLLRTRYGSSLDGYMRAMWARHGRTEDPYTAADLEEVLGEVSGDSAFAADFFRRHVRGSELPPYRELLARAGFLLRTARPGRAFLGAARMERRRGGGGIRIAEPTRIGSPLRRAGVARGDVLLSVGGREVRSSREVKRVVAGHRPGDRVEIRLRRRGEELAVTAVLDELPLREVVPFEEAGRETTREMEELRRAWLGPKVGG